MKYETEMYLLIEIFKKANPLLDGQSTSDYLDYFGYPISVTEGALVRLGLVEHDKQSGFGVKLTPRFMRMIADRGMHRPRDSVKTTTLNDRCLIASIFDVAVGEDDDWGAIEFGCKVLAVLGLLHKGADQGWKPTRLMQQLIFERCMQQCNTDGPPMSNNVVSIKLIPTD
jgi:hypothetical protein